MNSRKVKITYRNKWGELNKITGILDLPDTVTFTPSSNDEKFNPRRISSKNIADIEMLDSDKKLDKFKKQYEKE